MPNAHPSNERRRSQSLKIRTPAFRSAAFSSSDYSGTRTSYSSTNSGFLSGEITDAQTILHDERE